MGFERLPQKPEGQKEENKKPKTKLYKPFEGKEKHQKGMEGIRIDAEEEKKEEEITLEALEKQLEKEDQQYEKMAARLKELEKALKPNRLWTKVEVSGEQHTISFTKLELGGRTVPVSEVLEKKGNTYQNLLKTNIHLRLSKTAGRAEHLFLFFSTPLTHLLKGGGKIEQELAQQITNQFAGTKHYYEGLEQKQQQQKEVPPAPEGYEEAKEQIRGALQKQGAEISEVQNEEGGSFLFGFIARFPETGKQVHITTIDKLVWSVALVEDQKTKKELFNLRPQEVISASIEHQS